ncbi:cobaltochelatase subunit CobN [Ferdinandcohnia quinoae]|uniref:Cobaltochelatase subunit CobN n=1 Tax=Fredinandcohnia quinoae TaxID=2918902 RepID=A0AAW5EAV8_9BACI|nr:cobaltochelatase subunit CobN [Fredinandcohnia sp. SECRCQ15]MCH1625899.1 cobaltochelatase subunit CobN [Fredinandcohnia sp. SECRCQ15]
MHITIITSAMAILSSLASGFRKFEKTHPDLITLELFDAKGTMLIEEKQARFERAIAKSDFILVELRLCPEEWVARIAECVSLAPKHAEKIFFSLQNPRMGTDFKIGHLYGEDLCQLFEANRKPPVLFSLDNEKTIADLSSQLPLEKRVDFQHLAAIIEYWIYANEEYLIQFLLYIVREYGHVDTHHLPKPYKPIITDNIVIYENKDKRTYSSLVDYVQDYPFDQQKPTIGVIFLGYHFNASNIECVFEIIERLKPIANIIPVLASSIAHLDIERFKQLVTSDHYKVSLLLNFVPFRLGAGPMGGNSHEVIPMLEELGVPIMHPFFITKRTVTTWKDSIQGIDSSEYLTSVMLPELDGSIDTFPVGALMEVEEDTFDFENQKLTLIEERVQYLINRVKKMFTLQKKKNSEKKVAIICYNYPPGEDSIFSASYIDTFESVANILKLLKKEGYHIPDFSKEQLMANFTAGKLVNSGKWNSEETYSGFLRYPVREYEKTTKGDSLARITNDWGTAPGTIMSEDTDFLIPGMILGNIFIGLQPARSTADQVSSSYHDKTLTPHHQYVAFYSWLKENFQADALVHVGTHGTLEFLQGKEVAMSGDCYPDQLVGDLPHIYLYYIGNPSEAMIAKRRTHAVLVSYQTPPYIVGDLYGDYVQLEELLANYTEAKRLDPDRCVLLYDEILKISKQLHFPSTEIDEIEIDLYRMKKSLIPKGLHIFGKGYDETDARNYIKHVLKYDRGTLKSIKRLIAEDQAKDYDVILEKCDKEELDLLEEIEHEIINQFLDKGSFDSRLITSEAIQNRCYESLSFGLTAYHNSKNTHEEEGLVEALQGKYSPVRLAGDIVKSPDILPSGYNLYQFDPRLIPEKTAAERGKTIAENTITQYYDEFGSYPKCTGVVLWGFETSRTQGETIGQILHYLGVRITQARGAFSPQFEIIPIKELGRPRIDVVINITGFFRDIFPNVLDALNQLFLQIAGLDETDDENIFKANTNQIYQLLLQDGYSDEDAFKLATARIFGPSEGAYSTRVTGLVGERNWTEEKDLADGYIKDIQYVYGMDHRGVASEELFKMHLQAVDLVSQIRSNLELEVIDLDHYYEFFGGLSKSVEVERGIKTPVYISDTTGELIQTEDVQVSIERGVRTRLLNPKWIDGLLEHQQHGTQQILERFENMIGLAATTNKVDSWVFSEMHSTYIVDEKRREQLTENNRWAYHSMMERLFESHSRGYWDATEQELEQLKSAYLQLEGSIEGKI